VSVEGHLSGTMHRMSKSLVVAALDSIQGELTVFLKPLGFRRNCGTYNRRVGDGLVRCTSTKWRYFVVEGLENQKVRCGVNSTGFAKAAVRHRPQRVH
jgi:hypothetical protein